MTSKHVKIQSEIGLSRFDTLITSIRAVYSELRIAQMEKEDFVIPSGYIIQVPQVVPGESQSEYHLESVHTLADPHKCEPLELEGKAVRTYYIGNSIAGMEALIEGDLTTT